jgi:polygalacturonase
MSFIAVGVSALLYAGSPASGAGPGLAPQTAQAAQGESVNVRLFGAVGDGKNLDSPAINRAIDACVRAGGGTVFVPAGIYLSGSIHLKSNIHLYLDAGATILGAPQEMQAYDPA